MREGGRSGKGMCGDSLLVGVVVEGSEARGFVGGNKGAPGHMRGRRCRAQVRDFLGGAAASAYEDRGWGQGQGVGARGSGGSPVAV